MKVNSKPGQHDVQLFMMPWPALMRHIVPKSGWFAARPSGTDDIYKIYAESSRGAGHLRRILAEAQITVYAALVAPTQ